MKTTKLTCDISTRKHGGHVNTRILAVVFDHDQEDGRSKVKPYLDSVTIEICDECYTAMLAKRKYIYAYGAMGHNTYSL